MRFNGITGMFSVVLSIIMVVSAVGCEEKQSDLPTTKMQIGTQTFTLEIAKSDKEKEIGLMKRDSMPADHGMIFVFEKPTTLGFWMKNTRIPLDILFVDADGKVIAIKQMKAYDETPVGSPRAYLWAIELNKDAASAAGAKEGDQLTIPEEAKVK